MPVKPCPTFRGDRRTAVKRRRQRPRTIVRPRRAKLQPPQIYVRTSDHAYRHSYALAHLRNKRGYVYLTWRDGSRVRSFYLGKAPRSSPTPPASSSLSGRAPAPRRSSTWRRGKTKA